MQKCSPQVAPNRFTYVPLLGIISLAQKQKLLIMQSFFDGHTLARVLKETTEITGITPQLAHVEKNFE